MLDLRDRRRQHERDAGGDPDTGEQLLRGVGAQPAAVEVDERAQPEQPAGAKRLPRARSCVLALEGPAPRLPVAQREHPVGRGGRLGVVGDEQYRPAVLAGHSCQQREHFR